MCCNFMNNIAHFILQLDLYSNWFWIFLPNAGELMYKIKTFTFKLDFHFRFWNFSKKNFEATCVLFGWLILSNQAFIIAMLYEMPTHMRAWFKIPVRLFLVLINYPEHLWRFSKSIHADRPSTVTTDFNLKVVGARYTRVRKCVGTALKTISKPGCDGNKRKNHN